MRYPMMVKSLLDTDLYKFNMGQCIHDQFPDAMTTWSFKCRNRDVHFTPEMVDEIRQQVKAFCGLSFTDEELDYLETRYPWLKGGYINFLRIWKPRYEDIEITDKAECGLSIEAKGSWLNTTMYEVPILAIVNETYFRMQYDYDELLAGFKEKLAAKKNALIEGRLKIGPFSEFGTRRRLSYEAQLLAIRELYGINGTGCGSVFVGTSNVYIAMLNEKWLDIKDRAKGTIAHEFIMCVGQGYPMHNPAYSNHFAMKAWTGEYETQNGIALTDTVTTDVFLRDFGLTFATLFSGVRHDSGDPYEWGHKMLEHYKKLGIDPHTKTLLFSDSLNFEKASALYDHFKDQTNVAFGIGTYIANDTYVPALNIVMKVTRCNGTDVAKISDTPGKGMCKDQEYVDYLTRALDWRLQHGK